MANTDPIAENNITSASGVKLLALYTQSWKTIQSEVLKDSLILDTSPLRLSPCC